MIKCLVSAAVAAPLLIACATASASQSDLLISKAPKANIESKKILIVNDKHAEFSDDQEIVYEIMADILAWIDDNEDWSEDEKKSLKKDLKKLTNSKSKKNIVFLDSEDGELDIDIDVDFDDAKHIKHVFKVKKNAMDLENHAELIFQDLGGTHQGFRIVEDSNHMIELSDSEGDVFVEVFEWSDLEGSDTLKAISELDETSIEMVWVDEIDDFEMGIADFGIYAGLAGIRAGEKAIERSLKRGWSDDNGERRVLSEEDKESFMQALDELRKERENLEAKLETLADETR